MIKYKMKLTLVFIAVFLFFCGFTFAGWEKSATIHWSPNVETDLYGYKVYIGMKSRNYTDCVFVEKINNYHSFDKLIPGKIYYFCVTSVNNSGVESGYSEEVSKEMLKISR